MQSQGVGTPDVKSELELAKKLSETPRCYTLYDSTRPNEPLEFMVVGCFDDRVKAQAEVAALMNAIAKKSIKPPSFVIVLGDNLIPTGVDDCRSDIFKTHFDDIYTKAELDVLSKIPFFPIFGNHCLGLFGKGNKPSDDHSKYIHAQVLRTYLDEKKQISQQKIQQFSEEKLDVSKISGWVMPSAFYALHLPLQNLLLGLMNSNTLGRDYLISLTDKNPLNQCHWFSHLFQKHASLQKIACTHHPLIDHGKRTIWSDHSHYLTSEQVENLKKLGIEGHHQDILKFIFEKIFPKLDGVVSAHNHAQSYFLDAMKKFFQIISGGGGGDLQYRMSLNSLSCYIKEYGFMTVRVDQGKFIFDFYTTHDLHLQFDNVTGIARHDEKIASDPIAKTLRDCFETAYLKYIAARSQTFSGKTEYYATEGVQEINVRMLAKVPVLNYLSSYINPTSCLVMTDEIRNALNSYKTLTLADVITKINILFTSYLFKSESSDLSLITFFEEALSQKFDVGFLKLKELYDNSQAISFKKPKDSTASALASLTIQSPSRAIATTASPAASPITPGEKSSPTPLLSLFGQEPPKTTSPHTSTFEQPKL